MWWDYQYILHFSFFWEWNNGGKSVIPESREESNYPINFCFKDLFLLILFHVFLSLTDCRRCTNLERQLVCGTDSMTYFNACILDEYACKTNDATLQVKHDGPCQIETVFGEEVSRNNS